MRRSPWPAIPRTRHGREDRAITADRRLDSAHLTSTPNGICEGAGRCQAVGWASVLKTLGEARVIVVRGRGERPARFRVGHGCWVVSSRRGTRGPHQVPSVGEGGQARLPRHLFAHCRAHGAVRPRPSEAQSHTSATPVCWEPCRSASSPDGSCPSAHAATLSRKQRISPSRRP
jgi:hypothetical protein